MDRSHKAQPEKIKAKCGVCGEKLIPRYTFLGEIYNWSHKPIKKKMKKRLMASEINYNEEVDKSTDL